MSAPHDTDPGPPRWWRDPAAALLDRWAPRITLVVRDGTVAFLCGQKYVALAAHIYIKGGIICGVGEPPDTGGFEEDVDVLDGTERTAPLLAKFVSHGIRQVLGRSTTIGPVLIVDLPESSSSERACWRNIGTDVLASRILFR